MAEVSISDFAEKPATHIVSLGPLCVMTYNLRRYFNFSSPFPFDWWYTSETSLVYLLGDPDVNFIYDPSELHLVNEGDSVRHRSLGILLHHEFPRHWKLPRQPVVENWVEFIERPKRITRFLIRKLFELNDPSSRILFATGVTCGTQLPLALNQAFPLAEWCLLKVPDFRDPGEYWKGNPARWDEYLRGTGLTLDNSGHAEFMETEAQNHFVELV